MDISCLHLGILPHKNVNAVVDIISKYFSDCPFWAQLPNYSPVEGQFIQFLSQVPGIKSDVLKKKYYIDTQSYVYQTKTSGIIKDFEDINLDKLKKYRPNSVFFDYFLRIIDEYKPKYAKGQIIGPITLGLLLTDETGTPVIEHHKTMDLIIKSCCLQCISQICEIKTVYPAITPIIFVDEAELGNACKPGNTCQLNTISILKQITKSIKENGGIPAFTSSSCFDWNYAIKSGFDIISINPDTQFVTLLNKELKLDKFLNSNGKLSWNIIPESAEKLKNMDVQNLFIHYMKNVTRLKNFHKLHRSLILSNSIITIGNNLSGLSDPISEKTIVLGKTLAEKIQREAVTTIDDD